MKIIVHFVLWSSMALLGACAPSVNEFNFVEQFLRYPDRMRDLPQDDRYTRNLLERFRPRIFISPESYLPVDFYGDYLSRCVVRQTRKRRIRYSSVDHSLLSEIQDDSGLFLDFLPSVKTALNWTISDVRPVLYGRIYKDTLAHEDMRMDLLFLKYSCVFPYSGLPKKYRWWKKFGASILGDRKGWHELDIHGAVHIVVEAHSLEPVAIMLAQHNHHRVYLIPVDVAMPSDSRILISFSEYSNEPYLTGWNASSRYERVVGNPMQIAYLFGRTSREPLDSGHDFIRSPSDGAREIDMELQLLPLHDPLYKAKISLGDQKRILGIFESWTVEGPPGMDYYTLPQFKNLADLLVFWYVNPEDDLFFDLLERDFKSFNQFDAGPLIEHQKQKVVEKLTARNTGAPGSSTP